MKMTKSVKPTGIVGTSNSVALLLAKVIFCGSMLQCWYMNFGLLA